MNLPPFVLDQISIAAPCSASWEEMAGDDRIRFCSYCQQNVFHLSGMSSEEAVALVQSSEGRLCVRFYRRADGTVLTADCPLGVREIRHRVVRAFVGAVAALFAFAGMIAWGRSSLAQGGGKGPLTTLYESLSPPIQMGAVPPGQPVSAVPYRLPPRNPSGNEKGPLTTLYESLSPRIQMGAVPPGQPVSAVPYRLPPRNPSGNE